MHVWLSTDHSIAPSRRPVEPRDRLRSGEIPWPRRFAPYCFASLAPSTTGRQRRRCCQKIFLCGKSCTPTLRSSWQWAKVNLT